MPRITTAPHETAFVSSHGDQIYFFSLFLFIVIMDHEEIADIYTHTRREIHRKLEDKKITIGR